MTLASGRARPGRCLLHITWRDLMTRLRFPADLTNQLFDPTPGITSPPTEGA